MVSEEVSRRFEHHDFEWASGWTKLSTRTPTTIRPNGSAAIAKSYIARGWSPVPIPRCKKTPSVENWQKLRIAAAKRLLESGHRTMQEISDAVGYQDVAYFRQLFHRHTGASP